MPGRPITILAALLAIGAGALAATIAVQAPSREAAPLATTPVPDDLVEGQSAVESLRQHLRRAGLSDTLLGLETHRGAGAREEVVVCARIAAPSRQGGGLVDVVARVMATPRSNAAMASSASRPLPPFVVLEDGPGLNRNRPMGDAWRRFCAAPPAQAPASPAGAPAPPAAGAAPVFIPASLRAEAGAGEQVVLRGPGNIRGGPGGGAAVLRVAPRGASLRVLERAPGGWLQVDDGAGGGWVHGSLVETP
jgi:hypothetical protein